MPCKNGWTLGQHGYEPMRGAVCPTPKGCNYEGQPRAAPAPPEAP